MDFFSILSCLGGIALFLFGMTYMSEALKKCAGGSMKKFLTKMTSSPFKGFLIGLLVTMVIQSSTATNVMAVSFVNSGMMSLLQAVPLMIGSNLGTTVTAWLISLSSISGAGFVIQLLKPASLCSILAFVGIILYRFIGKERKKDAGAILIGFAILMFGMVTMSSSMSGLSDVPGFMQLFDALSNPFLGLLVGALLAGIMQSSSASIGVVQALAISGSITYSSLIPLLFGINIGQVVPVLISSAGASRDARRTAVVDLYINVLGALVMLPLYMVLRAVGVLPFLGDSATPITIAITNTGYKLICAIVMLPLYKGLVRMAEITVKEEKQVHETLLDSRLLNTPSLALAQCRYRIQECINATNIAFTRVTGLIDEWDEKVVKEIHKTEEMVDWYQDELDNYLAKLSTRSMTRPETRELSRLLHVISDYENITDHIYRMVWSYRQLWSEGKSFSEEAMGEMRSINESMAKILQLADDCFHTDDPKHAFQIVSMEHDIVRDAAEYRENHLERLTEGKCTAQEGAVFTDLLLDYERIADHLSKEARLTLVQSYKAAKNTGETRFLSALLDQNPEIQARLKKKKFNN